MVGNGNEGRVGEIVSVGDGAVQEILEDVPHLHSLLVVVSSFFSSIQLSKDRREFHDGSHGWSQCSLQHKREVQRSQLKDDVEVVLPVAVPIALSEKNNDYS